MTGPAKPGHYDRCMGAVSSTAMEMRTLAPDFPALYRTYFGFAWASLRRLGVAPATIDDAAQDLWVTVHRKLESLDPAASVKAWLFGIARRVASHYRRTDQRHRRKLAAYSVSDPRGSSEPMKRREAALTMEVFLAKLDETKRIAFVLSEVEGWSAPEIARVVGTSPNTVYSRVRLARQQLRKHLVESHSEFSSAACMDAMSKATQAPPDAAKRCWVALAPKLAGTGMTTAATASTGLLAKLKLVSIGALLGSLGLVGLDAALPERPASVASAANATAIETPRPATPPPTAAPPRPSAIAVAADPVSSAPTVETPAAASPPRRAMPSVAPTDPGPSSDLEHETKMLTSAKLQLEAGNHVAALSTIAAHAKEHPNSSLADLRNVLEVQATCGRGQRAQAFALAQHHAKHASPATAAKLMAACEPSVSTRTE